MLLLMTVAFGVFVAVICRVLDQVMDDLGHLEWPPERAKAATAATVRYAGAPFEYARSSDPNAPTTRELEKRATQALIQERERRLLAMTHEAEAQRFRRAG
jgi:hypothetical protein